MATITGKTPEAVDATFNASVISGLIDSDGDFTLTKRSGVDVPVGSFGSAVVSGTINSSGHLILTKRDGSTLDVGFIGRPIDTRPVGSIYISVDPANPSTIFGGTWTRHSKGRVLVGVDEADTKFDTVEELGGEQSHLLTSAETGLRNHGHSAWTDSQGVHNHTSYKAPGTSPYPFFDGMSINGATTQSLWGGTVLNDGAHGHNITVYGCGNYDAVNAHNNLQPYITVYIWKRTA